MKQNKMLKNCWKVVYPIGIHFLIANIIGTAAMFLLAFFIAFNAAAEGMPPNAAELSENLMEKYNQYALHMTFITAVICIPLFSFLLHRDRKKREFQPKQQLSIGTCIISAVIAVLACLSLNNVISMSGLMNLSKTYTEVSKVLYSGGIVFELICVGIVIPIAEELLFRGVVFNRLKDFVRPVYAIIFSALLFGAYHFNLVQFVYACLIGIILAYLYEETKSIITPVLGHIAANTASVVITETRMFESLEQGNMMILLISVLEFAICILLLFLFGKRKK